MRDIFYHVIDTETSDLSPNTGGEIIEIAIITCKNLEVIDIFHSYFNALKIHPKAYESHGISLQQLQGWPSLKNKNNQQELKDLIKYPFFAHNAVFDSRFLKHYNIIPKDHIILDTLKLCREEPEGPENNKLISWTKYMGITHRPHGALSDAFALCQLIAAKSWYQLVPEYIELRNYTIR